LGPSRGGAVPQKSAKPPIDTRGELSLAIGTSHDTLSKVKAVVYKWKSLTEEILRELWLAREVLSINAETRERTATGAFASLDKTWGLLWFLEMPCNELFRIRITEIARHLYIKRS